MQTAGFCYANRNDRLSCWPFSCAQHHDKESKSITTQLDKLLAAQEKATQKKHEAEQQEKRIRKEISDLKDKERSLPTKEQIAMTERFAISFVSVRLLDPTDVIRWA